MADGSERRVAPRYNKLPVLIEVPDIAGDWLRPIDVSMGGVMVELAEAPEVGTLSQMGIRIEDKVYAGEATVVWVRENLHVEPNDWHAGLWFKMPEEVQDEFEKVLEAVRVNYKAEEV